MKVQINAWPQVGDEVVDFGRDAMTRMTVIRFTQTQIVTQSSRGFEHRYQRKSLQRVGSKDWDSSSLIRLDDPKFLAYERKIKRDRISHRVEELMVHFLYAEIDDVSAADTALRLLASYLQKNVI